MSLGNSMDLPYEDNPEPMLGLSEDALIVGGVVVMAAVVMTGVGPKPALIFRFASPTGQFLQPIGLAMDADQAEKLPPLIQSAAASAMRAAERATS